MTNLYPIDNRLDFGSVLEGDVFARVFIKQRWADAWTERLDVIATQILWAAAPNTGSASIHRRYGPVVDRGDDAAENRTPIELGGWYVKIVVTCPDGDRNWHGYVIDVGDEPGGVQTIAATAWATGKQTWQCVGMLAALDRDPLRESIWYANSTYEEATGSNERRILSAPHFNPTIAQVVNGQTIQRQIGNAHDLSDRFTADQYIGGLQLPQFFTYRDILRYFRQNVTLRDNNDTATIAIEIPAGSLSQVSDWGRPELDCEGLTLKQALDRILNPSTGMGYWVWVKEPDNDDPDTIVIQSYTLASTAITVNPVESHELAATENIVDLYCGNDPATAYTIQSSLATRYNRVRAVGARRVTVLTRKFNPNASLSDWAADWTSTEVTAWQTAFPITGDTNTLELQQSRRDALEEGRFQRIYRFFKLVPRQLLENVYADDIVTPPVFPQDEEPLDAYMPDRWKLKILPDLPLKTGVDYTVETADVAHQASRAARRGIAVYGPKHNFASGINPGLAEANKKIDWANRSHVDLHYNTARPNYQINPSPYEDSLSVGLKLDVSGAWQGILGPVAEVGDTGSSIVPLLDTNTLSITVALEEDRRCEALYPYDPLDLPDVDSILELRIEAGDGFRRVDLLEGTIVAFNAAGDYQTVPETITLEDDSDELSNIARLAWEWYSKTRSILRLNSRRPTARLWPGVLVRDLNPDLTPIAREVNTTITEIVITLPTNPGVTPGSPRMEIVTSTGDVDFVRYVPRLRV